MLFARSNIDRQDFLGRYKDHITKIQFRVFWWMLVPYYQKSFMLSGRYWFRIQVFSDCITQIFIFIIVRCPSFLINPKHENHKKNNIFKDVPMILKYFEPYFYRKEMENILGLVNIWQFRKCQKMEYVPKPWSARTNPKQNQKKSGTLFWELFSRDPFGIL